jgi:hypothetical protein
MDDDKGFAMGFQSFQVVLEGGGASVREANKFVQSLPHVHPDHGFIQGPTYYLLDDGRHKIEMELWDDYLSISCRFTLCHPPSVDLAFLNLIRELMECLSVDVAVYEDVEGKHEHPFSLAEFSEFSAITLRSIAARRAEWIRFGGTETLAATEAEAHQRIILPRCLPVVGWQASMPTEAATAAKAASTQLS